MGLFGGFKAKFTRNNTAKVKPQDVVCLKYHIHSEFDQQEPPLPIQNNLNIKKNEVIRGKVKSRKELTKSAIFQETDTDYSSLSTPKTPQKSLSLSNLNGDVSKLMQRNEHRHREPSNSITVSTTVEVPSNGQSIAISDTKIGRNVQKRNGILTENVAIVTNNHLLSTRNNSKTEKHEQTVLKTFSTHIESSDEFTDTDETETYMYLTRGNSKTQKPVSNHKENGQKNLENEQSTLIFMTQTSTIDSDRYEENGEDNFGFNFAQASRSFNASKLQDNFDHRKENQSDNGNFKINFPQYSTTPDNRDEEYKVNKVEHNHNRTYSYSEDEHEEEEQPVFTRMGYSSQAASIFFGEDVEPEIARPRRIMLVDDDDERRSSGADC